jgi:hypothetical protein
MNVSISGSYEFISNSSVDTYGFIYRNSFNATSPNENLLTQNDDSLDGSQFQIKISLESTANYILVTTYTGNVKGSFSLIASGTGSVSFIEE